MSKLTRITMSAIAGLIPLCVHMSASAQTVAADDNRKIEEIIIYGKNFTGKDSGAGTKINTPLIETPQSISIIPRDLLDSWNTRKLTEALRYTPGIQAEAFGLEPRFTSLRLRGFDSTSNGLFRDGLILLNPFFTVSYNLEPFGAERIELPRGPASVLYGQGTAGGIINYISKLPHADPSGEFGVVMGNHERYEGEFDINSPVNEDGTMAFRAVGLFRDSGTQVEFLEEDRQFTSGALKWEISDDTTLNFVGNFQQENTKNSQALPADGTTRPNPNGVVPINRFTGEPGFDGVDRTEYSAGLFLDHEFSDSFHYVGKVRFNQVDLDDLVVYSLGLNSDLRTMQRGAFANYGHINNWTFDNQAHIKFQTGSVRHVVLAGLDYIDADGTQKQQTNSTTVPTLDVFRPVYNVAIPLPAPFLRTRFEVTQLGLYLQDQINVTDNLIVNLAGRYTKAKSNTFSLITNTTTQFRDDSKSTLRGGLVYKFDSGVAPYVSYAESFLPSTGVDATGKPFNPETGDQVEAGVKYQPKDFNALFTLAAFDLNRKNIVLRNPSLVFFQAGHYKSKGVEAEAYVSLDNGLSFISSYTYLKTEIIDHPNPALKGKQFTQIPKNKVTLWVDYNFPGDFDGLGVGAGVRYQTSTFSNDPNTIRNSGFTLADAAVHYVWEKLRFAINVQNLFDKRYTASCFVRNSLLCSFGETRAIRGTVTYRWGQN